MGKKEHAIFLDTADLSYAYVPVKLQNAKIVIACSNKKRGLGDSKYNERRSECETALAELQKVVDIKSLGELREVYKRQDKGKEIYQSVKDMLEHNTFGVSNELRRNGQLQLCLLYTSRCV